MIKNIIENNKEQKPNSSVIELLHKDFANCFNNEGKFDITKFQSIISDKVDLVKENQGFDFLGKSYARMLASMESTTVIVPDEEHNAKPENANSQNIYISGDNLDALKHLVKSYAGQVKCIYIDPPYNTGSDGFVYNDKFKFTKEQLTEKLDIEEELAERILGFNDGSTCSDAAWLTFMLPRLQKAKEMLTDDGVIFISIDDNEQANLKLLCDEVFGMENFIALFSRKGNGGRQDSTYYAVIHEYILCYARNAENFVSGKVIVDAGEYPLFDEKKNRRFKTQLLRKWGANSLRTDRPNLYYSIKDPDGNDFYPMVDENTEGRWRWQKTTMQDEINNDNIIFLKKRGVWEAYEKVYEPEDGTKTKLFSTIIDDVDNTTGATYIKELFGFKSFDYPKPTDLIYRIFEMAGLHDGDIIFDFFSGSATTADAIMRYNANNLEKNIKYIMVQWRENCKENSEAFRNGYKTIDAIGQKRIELAAKDISYSNPHIDIDFGFKHYTLRELPEETIDKLEEFKPLEFVGAPEMLRLMGGKEAVLTTWLCDDHYGLGAELQHVKLGGYTAYYIDKHLYLIDGGFDEKAMSNLMEKYERDAMDFHPATIVVFGYSFSLAEMLMLKKNIPALKDNENGTNITVDVRY